MHKGWLGVMVKAPELGRVKTRLAATHGDEFALQFARACLADTWESSSQLLGLCTELVVSGSAPLPPLPNSPATQSQAPGDLGARMEAALNFGLTKANFAMLIGTDSPGLPPHYIGDAADALRAGYDAVIGPTADGGFYLIGVRRCPSGLLEELPWSQPHTRAATLSRLAASKLTTRLLGDWFDVDDQAGLMRLQTWLATQPDSIARHCRALLQLHSRRADG